MGTGLVVVTTSYTSEADASANAASVVKARLAACVQIHQVTSFYRWKGEEVANAPEWLLTAKSTSAAAAELLEFLRVNHPYELPEILVTPVIGGSEDYLNWAIGEVAPSGQGG